MLMAAWVWLPGKFIWNQANPSKLVCLWERTLLFATVMARFRLFYNMTSGTQVGKAEPLSPMWSKSPLWPKDSGKFGARKLSSGHLPSIGTNYLSAHCTKFVPIASVTGSTTAS